MGLLFDLLTFPVTAPLRGARWAIERVVDQAEAEFYDVERLEEQLLVLTLQYELGEIDDATFEANEQVLLDRLEAARQHDSP